MVKLVQSAAAPRDLSDLVINTPCTMDWDRMDGDARKRFCSRCEKYVFNIAAMTRSEALQLIGDGDKKICARIFRRPDGTIVTSECALPGKRLSGRRFQFSIAALVALITSSAGLFAAAPWIGKQMEPLVERWFPQAPTAVTGKLMCEMGDMVLPPAATPVTPSQTPDV